MSVPVAHTSAPKRYRDLVHLLARSFYSGECPPPAAEAGVGTRKEVLPDLGIVVLDALARREWVKEDDLALQLKLRPEHVRRALRYFETSMLVVRYQRKEKAPRGNKTPTDSTEEQEEEEEEAEDAPVKQITVSYCCLDYPTILEITQLHLHNILVGLKRRAQDRSAEQLYRCPVLQCGREATTLDAFKLIQADGQFHCDVCDSVMEAAKPPLAQQHAAAEKLLVKAGHQLKPLSDLVTTLAAEAQTTGYTPEFEPFTEWLAAREPKEDPVVLINVEDDLADVEWE